MSALATPWASLPATTPEVVERIRALESKLTGHEPVEVPTDHLIHGGMYVRTILMPKGMVLTGALMKRATTLVVVGDADVLAGSEWVRLEGYNVIPGSAGRKPVFVSRSPVIITMFFPTEAKSIEEAEADFTDEADGLLSRRQNSNTVRITGE